MLRVLVSKAIPCHESKTGRVIWETVLPPIAERRVFGIVDQYCLHLTQLLLLYSGVFLSEVIIQKFEPFILFKITKTS
jgi:hypothetical protein